MAKKLYSDFDHTLVSHGINRLHIEGINNSKIVECWDLSELVSLDIIEVISKLYENVFNVTFKHLFRYNYDNPYINDGDKIDLEQVFKEFNEINEMKDEDFSNNNLTIDEAISALIKFYTIVLYSYTSNILVKKVNTIYKNKMEIIAVHLAADGTFYMAYGKLN